MKYLWGFAEAIVVGVVVALILLTGFNTVLAFGIMGLVFVLALFITVYNLVRLFVFLTIGSFAVLVTIWFASVYFATRRIAVTRRRLRLVQRRVLTVVVRLLAFSRDEPRKKWWQAIAQVVLLVTIVLMGGYLMIRDARTWNATLNVRLPTRAPVERVGRSEMPAQVSKLGDIAKYTNTRRDKVAAIINTMQKSARVGHPLISRCGKVMPLHSAEVSRIAELYVDLAEAPPIVKREYVLTEEQLTAVLSLVFNARYQGFTVDCVKLHRNYIRVFTTGEGDDGSKENWALGVSVVKDAGNLDLVVDELSWGRTTLQIGLLGLGVTGGRGGLMTEAKGAEPLADFFRGLDS